jgi:hypothetical protein
LIEIKESRWKIHVDALVGGGKAHQEGLDIRDENLLAVRGEDGEEGGGGFEAPAAIRRGGEVHAGDRADKLSAVRTGQIVHLAFDQVVDILFVFLEEHSSFGGDDDIEACKSFSTFD